MKKQVIVRKFNYQALTDGQAIFSDGQITYVLCNKRVDLLFLSTQVASDNGSTESYGLVPTANASSIKNKYCWLVFTFIWYRELRIDHED